MVVKRLDILRFAAFAMVIIFASIFKNEILAQTDAQFTQYWAVPSYYNPGAAGDTDFIRIRGGAKLQWLGIDNAPQNFMLTGDMPFKIGKQKIGVGLVAQQESIGLFSDFNVNIQANYKIRIAKGILSVGLQGGYFSQSFKGSEVVLPDDDDYHQSSDEGVPTQDLAGNTFDVSAGLWYNHPLFYFGVSGQHLLQPTIKMSLEGSENTESQEYETEISRMVYFTGGSNIQIKNTLFEIQPSFQVKTDFSTYTAEVTMRARYNKFITFGLGYRYKDAISAMIGAEYKNFFVGYAYDYPTSAIAKASSGSHELIAGYKLKLDFSGKNRNKHRSIRIM
jgi:type IX secretion system PorP/SprF family membrane protein